LEGLGQLVLNLMTHTTWRVNFLDILFSHAFFRTLYPSYLCQIGTSLLPFASSPFQHIFSSFFSDFPFFLFLLSLKDRDRILRIHVLRRLIILGFYCFFWNYLTVSIDTAVTLEYFDLVEQSSV